MSRMHLFAEENMVIFYLFGLFCPCICAWEIRILVMEKYFNISFPVSASV